MDRTDDYSYFLPPDRIAQVPAEPRDAARLLVCRGSGVFETATVRDLPGILRAGDLLVFNSARVRRARVIVRRPGGGKGELLFLRPWRHDRTKDRRRWEALARPSRKLHAGQELLPLVGEEDGCRVRVDSELGEGNWLVVLDQPEHSTCSFFDRHGLLPLPPYFRGRLDSEDRYQTVFADREGSAAAPTAGLHFTNELIARLEAAGIRTASVYLEIGADTLRPMRQGPTGRVSVRAEYCELSEEAAEAVARTREEGGRVIAVGTTVVRTLESLASEEGTVRPGTKMAELLIEPGYRFKVCDGLLTNFHAPRTSMVAMVAAFLPSWREAYQTAIKEGFRFLSFGDAMLVIRNP